MLDAQVAAGGVGSPDGEKERESERSGGQRGEGISKIKGWGRASELGYHHNYDVFGGSSGWKCRGEESSLRRERGITHGPVLGQNSPATAAIMATPPKVRTWFRKQTESKQPPRRCNVYGHPLIELNG